MITSRGMDDADIRLISSASLLETPFDSSVDCRRCGLVSVVSAGTADFDDDDVDADDAATRDLTGCTVRTSSTTGVTVAAVFLAGAVVCCCDRACVVSVTTGKAC